jgi:hypothetical protein
MPRPRKLRSTQRSAVDLDQIGDDEPMDGVQGLRLSGSSGAWKALFDRAAALAPGKGFRVPLQQNNMDPERAARTVRTAVRAFGRKAGLPPGTFGVWALAQGVFVWRSKLDLNPGKP